jgi:hypothetical protein
MKYFHILFEDAASPHPKAIVVVGYYVHWDLKKSLKPCLNKLIKIIFAPVT